MSPPTSDELWEQTSIFTLAEAATYHLQYRVRDELGISFHFPNDRGAKLLAIVAAGEPGEKNLAGALSDVLSDETRAALRALAEAPIEEVRRRLGPYWDTGPVRSSAEEAAVLEGFADGIERAEEKIRGVVQDIEGIPAPERGGPLQTNARIHFARGALRAFLLGLSMSGVPLVAWGAGIPGAPVNLVATAALLLAVAGAAVLVVLDFRRRVIKELSGEPGTVESSQ